MYHQRIKQSIPITNNSTSRSGSRSDSTLIADRTSMTAVMSLFWAAIRRPWLPQSCPRLDRRGLCWLNSGFRLYGCELSLTAVIILYRLLFGTTCFRRCFKLLLLCALRFHVQNSTHKPQNFVCGKSWAEYGHFWCITILQHAIYVSQASACGVRGRGHWETHASAESQISTHARFTSHRTGNVRECVGTS